jgi:UDP-N-acetylmuramyl pentapeptide synthase
MIRGELRKKFVCAVRGALFDAHKFVSQVMAQGAAV